MPSNPLTYTNHLPSPRNMIPQDTSLLLQAPSSPSHTLHLRLLYYVDRTYKSTACLTLDLLGNNAQLRGS